MPTIKTWTHAYNTTPSDQTNLTQQCRSFAKQLKDFLITSAGWTWVEGCDGSAISATDNWTALSSLNWAGSGAHSWCCLKSPVGIVAGQDGSYLGDQSRIWLTIDLNHANTYQATFKFHRVAPSGGTTSAAPTSTDQTGWDALQFLRSTWSAGAYATFHFSRCSTGEFWTHVSFSQTTYVPFSMGIFPFTGVEKNTGLSVTGWNNNNDYPFGIAFFARWADGWRGALQSPNYLVGSYDAYYAAGYHALTAWNGWDYSGAVATSAIRPMILSTNRVMVGVDNYHKATVGQCISTYFPSTGDLITGKQVCSPLYAMCESTNKNAMMGKIADIEFSNQGCTIGSVDSSASPTYVLIGDFWFPTNQLLIL